MLCYYLACTFCKIDLKLEVISFTELVFCVWPRTRMSTDESRASNQRSSTRSRRGFSRRAGSRTRSRQGFSWRVKTRTQSRRGFSRRAKLVLILVELFCLLVQQLWVKHGSHYSQNKVSVLPILEPKETLNSSWKRLQAIEAWLTFNFINQWRTYMFPHTVCR